MCSGPRVKGKDERQLDDFEKAIEEIVSVFFQKHPEISTDNKEIYKEKVRRAHFMTEEITKEFPTAAQYMNELFKTPNRIRADKRFLEFCYCALDILKGRTTKCTRHLTLFAMNFWFKHAVLVDRCNARLLLADFILKAAKNKSLPTETALKLSTILTDEVKGQYSNTRNPRI